MSLKNPTFAAAVAAIVAVFLGMSGAAQAHSATGLASRPHVAVGAPVRRVGGPRAQASLRGGSPEPSENWAGYDVLGGPFSSVTASWTQPAVLPEAGTSEAAFWVGLDGDGSQTVEQIGTESYSRAGAVGCEAWWEMFPAAPQWLDHFPVSPGDLMSATVISDGQGHFTLTLDDATSGLSFTTTQPSDVTKPVSAEVIVEAPADASGNLVPLADFGSVSFSGCAFDGQPVAGFDWNEYEMLSADGATEAVPSALGADGQSFSVLLPPLTSVQGADGRWHNKAVTLAFTAVDPGGPGVLSTEYSLDGGPWTVGTSLTIAAPADHTNDGIHTVRYRSSDEDGNVEPSQSCKVRIATRKPQVVAAWAASVARGHLATLRYRVDDHRPGPATASVSIVVKSASGRPVKSVRLAARAVDRNLAWRFVCNLAAGRYRFYVSATDAAGNRQVKEAENSLTVS